MDVGAYRTFCKVSPPLRPEADRTALVAALKRIHALLTPDQRSRLAYMLRTGALLI